MSHGTRKLAPTLTSPDGSRHIKRSRLTPRSRAPFLPDLEAAGSVSPDLEAVGSILPDLEAAGSVSPNPLGVGSVSPDLEAAGSASPEPLGAVTFGGWGYIYTFSLPPQQ